MTIAAGRIKHPFPIPPHRGIARQRKDRPNHSHGKRPGDAAWAGSAQTFARQLPFRAQPSPRRFPPVDAPVHCPVSLSLTPGGVSSKAGVPAIAPGIASAKTNQTAPPSPVTPGRMSPRVTRFGGRRPADLASFAGFPYNLASCGEIVGRGTCAFIPNVLLLAMDCQCSSALSTCLPVPSAFS